MRAAGRLTAFWRFAVLGAPRTRLVLTIRASSRYFGTYQHLSFGRFIGQFSLISSFDLHSLTDPLDLPSLLDLPYHSCGDPPSILIGHQGGGGGCDYLRSAVLFTSHSKPPSPAAHLWLSCGYHVGGRPMAGIGQTQTLLSYWPLAHWASGYRRRPRGG